MSEYQNNYNTAPADDCMDWGDEVSKENSFEVLPEGDYAFTVTGFERSRHNPEKPGKIPAGCNVAVVSFRVEGQTLKENFFLHRSMEWKITGLFSALGMREKGHPVRMNWADIVGRSGYLHLAVEQYTKRDGTKGETNRIKKLYAPWDKEYAAAANRAEQYAEKGAPVQPQQTAMWNQQPQGHWTAGTF